MRRGTNTPPALETPTRRQPPWILQKQDRNETGSHLEREPGSSPASFNPLDPQPDMPVFT